MSTAVVVACGILCASGTASAISTHEIAFLSCDSSSFDCALSEATATLELADDSFAIYGSIFSRSFSEAGLPIANVSFDSDGEPVAVSSGFLPTSFGLLSLQLDNSWEFRQNDPICQQCVRTATGSYEIRRDDASPAVPEPSAAATYLLGLAIAGAAMRRRRR